MTEITQKADIQEVIKDLEEVVEKYAKEKEIAIIFPREATLYRSSAVDITEEITQALNNSMNSDGMFRSGGS